MSVSPPVESGPSLDRRIARLIEGLHSVAEPRPYSTDDGSAQELAARLEKLGITPALEEDSGQWYCVFWAPRPGDDAKERVSSGSATTRALAICRAFLNLPLSGSGKRLRLRVATRGWIGPGESEPRPVESRPIPAAAEAPVGIDRDPAERPRAALKS